MRKNEEAEQLVHQGLIGHPPNEIAEELRDLYEKITFERHLNLKGIVLEPDEVQLAIAGNAVSYGTASSDEFLSRVENIRKIFFRTVERLVGQTYREVGALTREFKAYNLFISVPRAASFTVSLKLGVPKQPPLPI